jgi:GT2 family glycosyltransferase
VITVITPTWQRHDLLINRCIPSVAEQHAAGHDIEHIVVSDGPDPELARRLAAECPHVRYAELDDHNPAVRWGVRARLHGLTLAADGLIGWLDDDNAYRRYHIKQCAAALDADPAAGFAYSWAQFHGPAGQWLVGSDPPTYGGIDTSVIVHRKHLTDQIATWRDDGPQQITIDWDLVQRWLTAGITWAFVPATTVDYYVSG